MASRVRVRVARRAALACPTARTGKRPLSIGTPYPGRAFRHRSVQSAWGLCTGGTEPSRRRYTTTRSRSGRKGGGPEPAHERAGERRAGGPVGVEGRVVDRHLDAGDTAGSRRCGEERRELVEG